MSEDVVISVGGIASPDEDGVVMSDDSITAALAQSERRESRELKRAHEAAAKKRRQAQKGARKKNRSR